LNRIAPLTNSAPAPAVGVLHGLSFKQAFATLIIAVGLGLVSGAWDLLSDYRAMRARVHDSVEANLALVRGLAVEAAYQLSADLAGEVAGGLALDDSVAAVVLSDNYGGQLVRIGHPAAATTFPALAQRLFGDVADYQIALRTRAPDGTNADVGSLELKLDTNMLMNRYLAHVGSNALAGATRTALLCAMVVAVFYALITKPLLRITAAIGKVDPALPGRFLIETPTSHRRDELGVLVSTVNALLSESQRGLERRDAAEGELADLARDLERRVDERTAELAHGNARLEQANRFISDGIRYASRIQTALLPEEGALAGVVDEMAVGWHPLQVVGGDYYWAGTFGDKALVAVMDCTGHGVPGAFMTAVVASVLARILHHHGHDDPAAVLSELNRLVKVALRQDRPDAPADDGLDAAICVVDRAAGHVSYAGGNFPLLVHADGRFHTIKGDRRSLGYVSSPADMRFATHRLPLAPGATFYLVTDGLIDQVGGSGGRMFGRRRLVEVLEAVVDRPLGEQRDAAIAAVERYRGEQNRRDDWTFLAFRPIA
jgi:serine phosphatase RsbU (regulator of sigma subunit)